MASPLFVPTQESDPLGKPYETELAELPRTYRWALGVDLGSLSAAVRRAFPFPLIGVGSGGSFSAAEFGVNVHRELAGSPGSAHTPLEAVATGLNLRSTAVLMTTAGGTNPDVLGSFEMLAAREPRRLIVLCLSVGTPLAKKVKRFPFVDFVEIAAPFGRDGFLATNSLMASVVLLTRAYSESCGVRVALPRSWKELLSPTSGAEIESGVRPLWARDTLIVLHGPTTRVAAVDLESKFVEAALGNIWIADYRDFAHGRHHWLAKRSRTTAILAFITPDDGNIASKTLSLLPAGVPIVRQAIPFSGVAGGVAALARVLHATASAGRAVGIDPGRPGVPAFGRRIYQLRAFTRRAPATDEVPQAERIAIERKTERSLERLAAADLLDFWRHAYAAFTRQLRAASFTGVVLDYDGTLCGEENRYGTLRPDIVTELRRLAHAGIALGVATGRGKSVKKALRAAVPKAHWARVVVGYYNGADVALLSDDSRPDGTTQVVDVLRPVAEALARHPLLSRLASFEFRPHQVKVEATRSADPEWVWSILQQVVHGLAIPGVAILRSSHSMDVLGPGVDKRAVVRRVAALAHESPAPPILCIGDRGRYPGNDFLVLSVPSALSVDEVSPDATTCWNLAPAGQRGVDACYDYLRHLKPNRGRVRFSR